MRQGMSYTPADAVFPFKGITYVEPSTLTDPHLSPRAENVIFTKGQCYKRPGYTTLGASLSTITNPCGTPMALVEYEAIDGTRTLICLTTIRQFKWNGTVWSDITGASVWTGTEDNPVDYILGQSDQGVLLVITNGVDAPKYWSGAGNFALMSSLAGWNYPGGLTYANTVAIYNGYLVFANLSEGGVHNPQLIAWSDSTNWSEWLAGQAGAIRPVDTVGPIRKLQVLGDRLLIYADNSIGNLVYVGGDIIFSSERLVQQTRLVSPRAIVDVGTYHFLLDKENVQLYDGTRSTRAIGTNLHPTYRDRISAEYRNRAWGFLDQQKNQAYFAVPTGATSQEIYMVEYDTYDVSNMVWANLKYDKRMTCMGFYTRTATETWDDTVNTATWDSDAGIWDQGSDVKGFPQRVMADSTGQIYLADDTSFSDNTVGVVALWESIDFTIPQQHLSELGRWLEIELELKGVQADIFWSVDQGASWYGAYSLTLTEKFTKYKLFIDITGSSLRVRIQNSNTNGIFNLRWLRAWFRPAGAA
jgi:hypothetical protein